MIRLISTQIQSTLEAYFEDEIESADRNIYFEQYHASKELKPDILSSLFSEELGRELVTEPTTIDPNGFSVKIDAKPILIWPISESRWLFAYTSDLNRRIRDQLSSLDKRISWLLDVWIPSDIVNDIYSQYSPQEGSINLERRWDPYYIYQRTSDIPDNLAKYYNENINEFVEQEIEFNLKTPQWMADEALKEGMQEDLIEKSEISKTRFTYAPERDLARSDGGAQAELGQSNVTVRNGGQIVHRTGEISATYNLMNQFDTEQHLYSEFEEVVPQQEYTQHDSGIVDLSHYDRGRVLEVVFDKKPFDEEAHIKLSNLLTVGQSDVKIHGVVKNRGELWFVTSTHMAYEGGEYEILFAGTDSPNSQLDGEQNAALYIKPISASTEGLVYLFHKLREKFDSRTTHQIIDQLPFDRVSLNEGGEE